MSLPAGSYVGPFEIGGFLGAGGMGEVYRAKDRRLKREVAIKLLPARFSTNEEWLRRFESEAKAAGAINHPNVLAVYDVGRHEEAPYVVCELLEGETLRDKLVGSPIPIRRAFEYARQLCEGLAAAHDKGIVHRDLKPDNIFVTADGRLKILDFGLAKLVDFDAAPASIETGNTQPQDTIPGTILGTAGYMSPEQVRGQPIDHRTDIFSAGCILFEMFTGRRAFHAESNVETLNAILHEEPPTPSSIVRDIVPGLDRVIEHCLEKSPAQRFQTARDLAFALHALTSVTQSSPAHLGAGAPRRRMVPLAAVGAVVVGIGGTGFLVGRKATPAAAAAAAGTEAKGDGAARAAGASGPAHYTRLTFRGLPLGEARFGPDGKSVYYTIKANGSVAVDPRLYAVQPGSPESASIGKDRYLLAVSKTGELAVLLHSQVFSGFAQRGMLARMTPAGVPREIQAGVMEADWGADGTLAMVVDTGQKRQLEYPKGKVLFSTSGYLSNVRISPAGDRVAFIHHPLVGDDQGEVTAVDLEGRSAALTKRWASSWGLAWRSADEIWFTATAAGADRELHAVTLGGKERLVGAAPEQLTLLDIAPDGQILLSRSSTTQVAIAMPPGGSQEVNLSWFDWTLPSAITHDGKKVLLTESGAGGGVGYRTYVRKSDRSDDAVLLCEGFGQAFSPDGQLIVVRSPVHHERLQIVPVGAGETKTLPVSDVIERRAPRFLPDGKRIFFIGKEAGAGERPYIQDIGDGKLVRLPEHAGLIYDEDVYITPDGRAALAHDQGHHVLVPLDGSAPIVGVALTGGEQVAGIASDGRALVISRKAIPWKLAKLDVRTGKREAVRDIRPTQTEQSLNFVSTEDGAAYAYSSFKTSADLYLAEGFM